MGTGADQGFPCPRWRALCGFPAHSIPLGTSTAQHGTAGGLKSLQCVRELEPGLQVQRPVLHGHPAWHCGEMDLLILSRNSWLCKRQQEGQGQERQRVHGGCRVQTSDLIFSEAGSPHNPPQVALLHSSDSAGSNTSPNRVPALF